MIFAKFIDTILAFTTDGWSSRVVESYLSLTIHYLDKNFYSCHHMLSLFNYVCSIKSPTPGSIKDVILTCLTSWKLYDDKKPLIFVTNNGRNIIKMIEMCQMWTWIPCFAHTLQMTIKATLKSISLYADTSKKWRIMGSFVKSTSARKKFKQIQISMSPNNRLAIIARGGQTLEFRLYNVLENEHFAKTSWCDTVRR